MNSHTEIKPTDLSDINTHTLNSWLIKKNGHVYGVVHTQKEHDLLIKHLKAKGYKTNGLGIYTHGTQHIELTLLNNQSTYNNFSNLI